MIRTLRIYYQHFLSFYHVFDQNFGKLIQKTAEISQFSVFCFGKNFGCSESMEKMYFLEKLRIKNHESGTVVVYQSLTKCKWC